MQLPSLFTAWGHLAKVPGERDENPACIPCRATCKDLPRDIVGPLWIDVGKFWKPNMLGIIFKIPDLW